MAASRKPRKSVSGKSKPAGRKSRDIIRRNDISALDELHKLAEKHGSAANKEKMLCAISVVHSLAQRIPSKADQEATERQQRDESAKDTREWAMEDLRRSLLILVDAKTAASAIHQHKGKYFPHEALALFADLAIKEAGAKLEQAMCNLAIIDENDYGYFVTDLKREGPKPQKAEAAQKVAHG